MCYAVKCQRFGRFCEIVMAWKLGQLIAGNPICGGDATLCNTES